MTTHKQAVVFAGGASHGAYHVGVLQSLFNGESAATSGKPFDPDIIAGISAGAFNAGLLLSELEGGNDSPGDKMERVWLRTLGESKKSPNGVMRVKGNPTAFDPRNVLKNGPINSMQFAVGDFVSLSSDAFARGGKFLSSSKAFEHRVLESLDLSSVVSMKPFRKSIRETIDFKRLRDSSRELRIGAVKWEEGQMRYFTGEEMTDSDGPKMILASTAVPGIFPRVKLQGDWYCDGAAVENTPLSGAIAAGADEIHVITSVPHVNRIPVNDLPNTIDTLYRFIVIRTAATLREDIEHVRDVNDTLSEVNQIVGSMHDTAESKQLALGRVQQVLDRLKADTPMRRLTVHVHHPAKSLGGIVGLLNFDRKFLARMIRKGYRDTCAHDCQANGCVVINDK